MLLPATVITTPRSSHVPQTSSLVRFLSFAGTNYTSRWCDVASGVRRRTRTSGFESGRFRVLGAGFQDISD